LTTQVEQRCSWNKTWGVTYRRHNWTPANEYCKTMWATQRSVCCCCCCYWETYYSDAITVRLLQEHCTNTLHVRKWFHEASIEMKQVTTWLPLNGCIICQKIGPKHPKFYNQHVFQSFRPSLGVISAGD